MHYGGEKLGKEWSDFDLNKLDHTFWFPDYGEKFHQNRARIATVGGWTDVTDASEFICPMLRYSNGTDKDEGRGREPERKGREGKGEKRKGERGKEGVGG